MTLPLSGFRILSLAEQYPGPYATLLLADLGADVILVERPNGGDPSRRYDGHFESLNRGKRSICLDLKSSEGRAVFLALVDTADIVVEGFRPGVMARLGLGAEDLRARKPDLVFVSVSSFGQDGPLAHVAGHDFSIQGVAGLIDVPAGEEASLALPVLPLADIASAMFAALGMVTALLARARSGQAVQVDVSMLDALVSWMTPFLVPAMNGLQQAPFPPKEPGYGLFGTADGRQLTLSIAGEDHLWRELCAILDLADLVELTEREREERRSAIAPRLREAIARHPLDWLTERFEARKIAFGPVRRPAEVATDAQVAARGLVIEVPGPGGTPVRHIRQPIRFDGAAAPRPGPAPHLGEHTDAILDALGYAREERARLRASGRRPTPGLALEPSVRDVGPTKPDGGR